jgi:hypothetical protein
MEQKNELLKEHDRLVEEYNQLLPKVATLRALLNMFPKYLDTISRGKTKITLKRGTITDYKNIFDEEKVASKRLEEIKNKLKEINNKLER